MSAQHAQSRRLISDAVRKSSLPGLRDALALSSNPELLEYANHISISRGKVDLARYLLESHSPPASLSSVPVEAFSKNPSVPLLDLLLAHGLDINEPRTNGLGPRRLIDDVCDDEGVVKWLIAHGATVDHGQDSYPGQLQPKPAPLLETCASMGSVESYKALKAAGAKGGRRVLHKAVSRAASQCVNMQQRSSEADAAKKAFVGGPKSDYTETLASKQEDQELEETNHARI